MPGSKTSLNNRAGGKGKAALPCKSKGTQPLFPVLLSAGQSPHHKQQSQAIMELFVGCFRECSGNRVSSTERGGIARAEERWN